MKFIPGSLLRYGIAGLVQNGIFYLCALLLVAFGWQAWQAMLVLNPLAVIVSFIANLYWSFNQRRRTSGQFWRYIVLYAVTYVMAVSFTWWLELLGVASWLAALATIGLAAIGLYLALNFWIFRAAQGTSVPARSY
jgi:putative flippase GtrA